MTVLWEKGKSGNPKGRPKGSGKGLPVFKSWRTLISELADKRDVKGIKMQTRIAKTLLKMGLEGDLGAIREIMDRCDGKAISHQITDITTGGESLNAAVSFVGMPVLDMIPADQADDEPRHELSAAPLPLTTAQDEAQNETE